MTDIRFIKGDARHLPIENESVQCIVTSPPYWGLRKYSGEQELMWGGKSNCDHQWIGYKSASYAEPVSEKQARVRGCSFTSVCSVCSACRTAYGLEPTIEMYVDHTITILRELRRVLRTDGVLFWNIGDSYGTCRGNTYDKPGRDNMNLNAPTVVGHSKIHGPVKSKDLCLIPARVAIAAQLDGWWIRSMIVWAKPNPMPESCKDRPTDAYEHIIMLTKAERYFWDFDAVQEPCSENTHMRVSQNVAAQIGSQRVPGKTNRNMKAVIRGAVNPKAAATEPGNHRGRPKQNQSFSAATCLPVLTRNMRNIWEFTTQGYSGAHFATFPEELPRRCILAASRVGDVVLDPFAGSGTVGRVAIELNRKAILNDLAYHDLSEKRTKNVQRRLL